MNESTTEPIGVHGQLPPAHPCGVTHADADELRMIAMFADMQNSNREFLRDLAARIDAGLRSKQ